MTEKDGENLYVQVAMTAADKDTAEREYSNLASIPDNYEKIGVTYRDSFPNTVNGINFSEQSFTEIEKQIERVLADKGIAVCVFDADITRTRQAEKLKYEQMLRKYSKNPSILHRLFDRLEGE